MNTYPRCGSHDFEGIGDLIEALPEDALPEEKLPVGRLICNDCGQWFPDRHPEHFDDQAPADDEPACHWRGTPIYVDDNAD